MIEDIAFTSQGAILSWKPWAVFERISGPRKWVDIDGGHFGLLWHPSDLFDQASRAQIGFLKAYLK